MKGTRSTNKSLAGLLLWLEGVATGGVDLLTFVLLFLLNPGHSLREVRQGRMEPSNCAQARKRTTPDGPEDAILYCEMAQRMLDQQRERSAAVDEKSQTLLTVAGLLVAAYGIIPSNPRLSGLGTGTLIILLIALYLLLRYFRTGAFRAIEISEIEWSGDNPRNQIAEQMLEISVDWSLRCDFRIGVQRAARRAIMIGLFLLGILGATADRERPAVGEDTTTESVGRESGCVGGGECVAITQ